MRGKLDARRLRKGVVVEMPVFSFVRVGLCEREREHMRKRMDGRCGRCKDKRTALQLYMLLYYT